ncbi:hypothetical protein ISS05_01280 [Candidatus Woesearchaeota archaeon]|nr:hypothetical protein [Candidatus Woesearchaeota archaeon]
MELPIEEESMFYPRGNGTYDASIEYGKKVIPMIEGYFKEHDIVFVMSHKESIGAMSLAIPAHYKIPFSDTLQPCIKPPDDEVFIEMCMDEYDLGRNKTIDKMIDDYPDIFLYTPSIPEASAAFFDIEAKVCELTRCGLRSMS